MKFAYKYAQMHTLGGSGLQVSMVSILEWYDSSIWPLAVQRNKGGHMLILHCIPRSRISEHHSMDRDLAANVLTLYEALLVI